ncbi:MAG: DUF5688 family protein [Solobacterium sp.]|nr:DUF5688 family protein [Solobacterium sp.]
MNMTYEEFEQAALENIRKFLPEEYTPAKVAIIPQMKLGKTYRAVSVIPDREGLSGISVSLGDLYERYQMYGDLETVFSGVFRDLFEHGTREIQPFLSSYENICDRLFARLSNEKRNRELLKEIPYTMFRDLAITYHILLNMDDAGMSSVMITNKLMEQYGVTKKQLHEDALRSSMILFPAVFENSTEFMEMHVQGKVLPKEDRDISGEEMKVLTNEPGVNGAAVIVYPGMLEQIADQLDSSYCIIPSSIHELYITTLLSFEDLYEMQQIVRHVNGHYVKEEEYLSDKLYVYHRESGKLFTVGFDDREDCIVCSR